MKQVTRFEYNLLTILEFFLGRAPFAQARPLLEKSCSAPSCLRRETVELVQDFLAKGCVQYLAYQGGWRRERFLRDEKPVEGRLWERTAPKDLSLSFTGNTLDFLIWITTVRIADAKQAWWKPKKVLGQKAFSIGDLFFFYRAYEAVRETEWGPLWRRRRPFHQHGLCWLANAADYSQPLIDAEPDYSPWLSGVGSCILEACQTRLAERWLQMEQDKSKIIKVERMRKLGQVQQRALDRFLAAAEQAGRWDLTRFLLAAARRLLADAPSSQNWVRRLNVRELRLADRMEVYRSASVFLQTLARLRQWREQFQHIGYFDEGYGAAQLYKADWEELRGDLLCDAAQRIVAQLEPMQPRQNEDTIQA